MALNTDKIAFILNPSSGSKRRKKQSIELEQFLLSDHPKSLIKPGSSGEALEIVKELAEKNYKAVVACGGDGTVNLVSKGLLHSETALMVIGLGSGNGFARHHHIPLNWQKALQIFENPKESWRDTGRINGEHFINIAGIGFAARISEAFRNQTKRGLAGYARTVFKNLNLKSFPINLENENSVWQGETWMVEFCNGTQWGNNFKLEPGARDDDGTLNAVLFKKMNVVKIPALGFRLATASVPQSADVVSMAGAKFALAVSESLPVHVDGDSAGRMSGNIHIEVVPKSIKIWTA